MVLDVNLENKCYSQERNLTLKLSFFYFFTFMFIFFILYSTLRRRVIIIFRENMYSYMCTRVKFWLKIRHAYIKIYNSDILHNMMTTIKLVVCLSYKLI